MKNTKQIKLTVSLGIPAYNEEANIKHLLKSLLAQKQDKFLLKEIIVISDGSTDKTVKFVQSFRNPKIRVIDGTKRFGQSQRQNQIISLFKGDILVLIEADTLPSNSDAVNNLVTPFCRDNNYNLGMVVGYAVGIAPKNFFEKITVHGAKIKKEVFNEWKDGKNLYTSNGYAMRAFSPDFLAQLKWPEDVSEDSYAYLKLCQLGFSIVKRPNAITYVKNVTNFNDRLKQSTKFISGKNSFKNYFSPQFVDNEFNLPITLILKHILKEFIKQPALTLLYLIQVIFIRLLTIRTPKFNGLYSPYKSTKTLILSDET